MSSWDPEVKVTAVASGSQRIVPCRMRVGTLLGLLCYLASSTHTHVLSTAISDSSARAIALKNTSHLSPTRVNTSVTTPALHVRTRMCGTMYYTRAYHTMRATTITRTLTFTSCTIGRMCTTYTYLHYHAQNDSDVSSRNFSFVDSTRHAACVHQ